MIRRIRFSRINLSILMVATLVLLVIVTASAVGLPAIWLIHKQLDEQAWALVESGSRSALVLMAEDRENLENLALLTAQRPTLARLVRAGDLQPLGDYLQILRTDARLDVILICEAPDRVLVQAGDHLAAGVCQPGEPSRLYQATTGADGNTPMVWLLAAQTIPEAAAGKLVVVGLRLDDRYAAQLSARTGLEHILLFDGKYSSSSLAGSDAAWEGSPPALPGEGQKGVFTFQNTPHYAVRSPLADSRQELVSFLSTQNITTAQQTLTRTLVAGILLVVLVSSVIGGFLASRINRPLVRLRNSATALRRGDLTTPIVPRTRLEQIAQVAYALEDARVALNHSLTALRQETEWNDHLLNSILEGILALDRQNRITFFSQGAERITGYRQERVIGKPVDAILQSATEESFSQRVQNLGGKPAVIPVLIAGRRVALAVTAAELIRSEVGRPGIVLVCRDVSEEEAMRRLLGDFLANITHEFRTPLTALAASIELLIDQLPTLTTSELGELLNSLHLGILGLQTLVDNLLEGASIEAGRFKVYPRPVQIDEIIRETSQTMKPLFEKYNQQLVLEVEPNLPEVQADPRRMGQVMINLLSNAIKWSPAGAEIGLSARKCEAGVQVAVSDCGPGVAQDQKPELFNRFVHLRSGSQRAEYGAGIGLSVVKAIVEAQGGEVGVSDRPEGGSVFWFTVPEPAPEALLEGGSG
ncbi:MAG: ATP-binding protein [Anaerolineales bacterium]|jgi:PAS domain S-box-containing protein|nr:ATP-binding protein [Anaerolineales bacterium]